MIIFVWILAAAGLAIVIAGHLLQRRRGRRAAVAQMPRGHAPTGGPSDEAMP